MSTTVEQATQNINSPTPAQIAAAAKKWTSTDGPRRTKKISDILSALRWAGRERVILSGVVGVNEYKTTQTELFSSAPASPAFYEAIEAIGGKYGYTITPGNYDTLTADLTEALTAVNAARPIIDERRTAAQDAERNARFIEQAAQAAEAQKTRNAAEAEARRALVAEYPYLEQAAYSRRSNHALAGHNIRLMLAHNFPGLTVRAKTETFSGGDSCDVYYSDGPTEKEIKDLIGIFQEGSFDGMTDMYNHSSSPWHGLFGGVKYLFIHRENTKEAYIKAAEQNGVPADAVRFYDYGADYSDRVSLDRAKMTEDDIRIIHRALAGMSFYVRPTAAPIAPDTADQSPIAVGNGATIRRNTEKGGIEISFPDKPSTEVLEALRAKGWRWSRFSKVWYKQYSEAAEQEARNIISQN